MTANPLVGVVFHWLGGLAAGSFYVPYRGVKRWSWETYWMLGGVFSWAVAPLVLASLLTEDLFGVLAGAPAGALFWSWFFGLLWGLGGLTFGLSMRYLGMSLGYGVALGTCAVFGTLIPPLFRGTLGTIAASSAGRITLTGVAVCALAIAISALAGLQKERELSDDQKKASVAEFDLRKGLAVAVFCGVMSACMAFALAAGEPIGELSAAAGTPVLWTGLPKLVVVLCGGLASNAIWCSWLHVRHRSGREYLAARTPEGERIPRLANVLLCALAGTTWYFQFFFYTMGETQMGELRFSSWTLHMASIILFSTLWGVALKEWRGTSRRTHALIAAGIAGLLASTLVVGYGNYLDSLASG
ncbi:MAG: L-rhamnose/proton symporter RhaT [Planctomycetes bacterium]|nr:L-rhamnose/proton symporter RhaT [Planctomycetota bacterium]